MQEWVTEASKKIKTKLEAVAKRNTNTIPYTSTNGMFDDCSNRIGWWTNGFWGGILWQLYHTTHQEFYREIALNLEKKLDENLTDPQCMDHDSGFKWLPTAIANYRETGDWDGYRRGWTAANDLAGRFNPAGKYIRAWNDWGTVKNAGIAIIDCMMNLPLLYWASEQTKDPRYAQIANLHAQTVIKHFVREDGSVIHIGEFDPITGEFLQSRAGQGYCHGSSWTRGQAWGLYGFVLSFLHTRREEYLDCAVKIADYFISHIPESGFIPVDFCQPADITWEDSSAAAIAACGLLELAKAIGDGERSIYHQAALKLLKTLYDERCDWSVNTDAIVTKCTAAYSDANHEFTIIYGDYYFIEAIFKLTGEELFIW